MRRQTHGTSDTQANAAKKRKKPGQQYTEAELKAKKKTCVEIESALFDIVVLMLTKEFGDGEGKISWRTAMKDKISEIISEIDTSKGKGKGYAKGVAEASANQNDADDADMTDGH